MRRGMRIPLFFSLSPERRGVRPLVVERGGREGEEGRDGLWVSSVGRRSRWRVIPLPGAAGYCLCKFVDESRPVAIAPGIIPGSA